MAKRTAKQQMPDICDIIVKAIEDKKGEDIVKIDLTTIKNSYFDTFIICTGNSAPQVEAICDSIDEHLRNVDVKPMHIEGLENKEWVIMDYFNVLVHIFRPEARAYYGLEQLWADADFNKIG